MEEEYKEICDIHYDNGIIHKIGLLITGGWESLE